jgi:GGDEF domain-containing protein
MISRKRAASERRGVRGSASQAQPRAASRAPARSALQTSALSGDREALHAALGVGRSAKYGSLVLFDVDHFAAAPTKSQAAAHAALVEFARQQFGAETPMYGHSKDGIAVLSPLPPAEALLAAERVRMAFGKRFSDRDPALTVSAGVAGPPTRRGDLMLMLWSAESALVRAKETGRDKVAISPGDSMIMKSTYYPRALLERLALAARGLNQPESVLLREALERYLREQVESAAI